MGRSKSSNAIGFPPPYLGDQPLRLEVLAETDDWIALDKPAGVAIRQHPWNAGVPDMDSALNAQLASGKPELLRRNASAFGSVYYLDPEASGVALFGKTREAVGTLRNCFGSQEMHFVFYCIAGAADGGECELLCEAPLLPHRVKPKMIPSSAKGKKAWTRFTLVGEGASGLCLWRAECDFLRPHQIRAHAATLGFPLLGDALYGGGSAPSLRDLKPKQRGPGLAGSAFEGLALHLALLEPVDGDCLRAQVPSSLGVFLRLLGLEPELAGGGK
ncbi:pseudouridine synthase [Coraliomargarita parva]|uniref:pseudouridine synthase n=1 Tax=Coraliomargarita parva TaxID=3014050 RepID=UPI0022B5B698|nr:pseudouridine synthase [Coraliomargarita parva]